MAALKLIAVGTATGVVIPEDMLFRMKVSRGDELHVVETPFGCLITTGNSQLPAQVEAGQQFVKAYRKTFKALAK